MTGRPSRYTAEIADEICERLASGESLRSICRNDHMPGQTTVFRWLSENTEFWEQYARAREAQAECLADELVEIADEVQDTDDMVKVQAAKLRIDTRKWAASKLKPSRYGDRPDHNVNNTTTVITRMEIVAVYPPAYEEDDGTDALEAGRYLPDAPATSEG